MGVMDGSITHVVGRLSSRRALGRRLVFYDLENDAEGRCVELALRAGQGLDGEGVQVLRDSLKLGDVVRASGWLDGDGLVLSCRSVQILGRWESDHPGVRYLPKKLQPQPTTLRGPSLHTRLGVPAEQTVNTGSLQACKYWLNTGSCARGYTCPFAHASIDRLAVERSSWITARRRNRRQAAASAGDPHADNALHKRQRAAVFCDWLVDKYGAEYLTSGSGVLDVAGGRGELAFNLHTLRGIPTTLIDPRPQKFSKRQHDHLHALRSSCPDEPASVWLVSRAGVVMERRALQGGALLPGLPPPQILAEFGPGLWHSPGQGPLLQGCSLVVGLHPDQATDAISDFAVQFGKPHAIVPCCVFPRSFPHRRLPPAPTLHTQPQAATADAHGSLLPEAGEPASARPNDAEGHLTAGALGSTVTLHHELVEYLRLRAGAAGQVEYLSFEGMNQVVFNTPEVV